MNFKFSLSIITLHGPFISYFKEEVLVIAASWMLQEFKDIRRCDLSWDHGASAAPPPCRPISCTHILKLFHRIISCNVLEHVSISPTFLVDFQGSDLTGTHGMQVSRENEFQCRSVHDVTLVWSRWESETWVTPGSLVANYSVWKCGRKCYSTGKTNTSRSNLVWCIRFSCSVFEHCTVCFKDSIGLK